ncbi:hypothetical protein NUW54_g8328 [Trametes sanguinea]|uniref:Uncharacterized protein n=1 Tax=Trametes sanguinea TaxID=158606 RepID=A0ACC1PF81_9APHY|nr:hypothetical protein NUW54_g8328 [Trametes sanguinea]
MLTSIAVYASESTEEAEPEMVVETKVRRTSSAGASKHLTCLNRTLDYYSRAARVSRLVDNMFSRHAQHVSIYLVTYHCTTRTATGPTTNLNAA